MKLFTDSFFLKCPVAWHVGRRVPAHCELRPLPDQLLLLLLSTSSPTFARWLYYRYESFTKACARRHRTCHLTLETLHFHRKWKLTLYGVQPQSLWGGPKIQNGSDLKTNSQAGFKNECSKVSKSADLADTRFFELDSKIFELCRFYTNIQNSRIICGFFLDFGRFNSGFTDLMPFHNTQVFFWTQNRPGIKPATRCTTCTLLLAGAFHCLAIRMKLLSLCKDMRGVQSSPNRYLGKLVRPFLHKSVMFEIHTNCKGAE